MPHAFDHNLTGLSAALWFATVSLAAMLAGWLPADSRAFEAKDGPSTPRLCGNRLAVKFQQRLGGEFVARCFCWNAWRHPPPRGAETVTSKAQLQKTKR